MSARKSSPASSTADREIVLTRVFDATREIVFDAFTDPKHVGHWWGPTGFTNAILETDVRPGGVWRFVMHAPDGTDYPNKIVYSEIVRPERLVGAWQGGKVSTFDAIYRDIARDQRIVYAYMQMDGTRISVSLATVEFTARGAGTLMKFTEQGAYLDDFDNVASREHGTRALIDNLEATLQRETA